MACSKISQWDWKEGSTTSVNIGDGVRIPLNYFSCGTYYFDGEYQVVKFPKGMQLYHGSGALAKANVEYPAGIDFYKPYNKSDFASINNAQLMNDAINQPNQSVAFETSKFLKVSPSWFGTPNIAQMYSLQDPNLSETCGDMCVAAYELKEDAVFFLLDNNFNIWRLLKSPSIPDIEKDRLRVMFDLKTLEAGFSDDIFGQIRFKHKRRRSYRDVDVPFIQWLCTYLPKDYAGYAANTPVEKKQIYFHLEFMFCNPLRWLKRNLLSPLDWQHSTSVKDAPVEIARLLEQMALYKSTNVDFHAGNLLEHSIWSLLFAEQLVLNTSKYGIPDIEVQKKIAATAFIHDIGKMAPNNDRVSKRSNDCVYFSIPEHPVIGGDYIRGTRLLPILGENMKEIGSFNIFNLLGELGFKEEDLSTVAKIIDLHWDFGSYCQKWQDYTDLKTVDEYIDHVGENESFTLFYALVVVSVADILASQPYGMNNLTAELNHNSRFFPFISNVPKKYRGGDIADETACKRNAFAERVLDRVLERKGSNTLETKSRVKSGLFEMEQ